MPLAAVSVHPSLLSLFFFLSPLVVYLGASARPLRDSAPPGMRLGGPQLEEARGGGPRTTLFGPLSPAAPPLPCTVISISAVLLSPAYAPRDFAPPCLRPQTSASPVSPHAVGVVRRPQTRPPSAASSATHRPPIFSLSRTHVHRRAPPHPTPIHLLSLPHPPSPAFPLAQKARAHRDCLPRSHNPLRPIPRPRFLFLSTLSDFP